VLDEGSHRAPFSRFGGSDKVDQQPLFGGDVRRSVATGRLQWGNPAFFFFLQGAGVDREPRPLLGAQAVFL
jgi:hypothetical protein